MNQERQGSRQMMTLLLKVKKVRGMVVVGVLVVGSNKSFKVELRLF
jgi:hypothetical protein